MRIESLTGLRILAATAVFLSHLERPDFIPARLSVFMHSGYSGVTVFFILSGFVLAWNYADRLTPMTRRAVWSFAIARFARIYPLYLVVLLYVSLSVFVTQPLARTWWLHLFAVQTWHPDLSVAYGLNAPGWSIGVEFFLYALFPFLVLLITPLRDKPRMLLLVALLAVLVVGALAWWCSATGRGDLSPLDPSSAHRWLYRTPLTRVGDFVVGMVTACLILRAKARPRVGNAVQIVAIMAILAIMSSSRVDWSVWSWDFAYMAPTGLLLWGLATSAGSPVARLLGSKPMVLAGEASFAFYLIHYPMLQILGPAPTASWWGWLLITALHFGVILLTAVGAHFAIELPAQRFLRNTLDHRKHRAGTDPSTLAPTLDGLPQLSLVVSREAELPGDSGRASAGGTDVAGHGLGRS